MVSINSFTYRDDRQRGSRHLVRRQWWVDERPKAGISTITDILFCNAREHATRNALGWPRHHVGRGEKGRPET
jgi:hypothetical protein